MLTDVEAVYAMNGTENDSSLVGSPQMLRLVLHNVEADKVPWCPGCKPCSSEPKSLEL